MQFNQCLRIKGGTPLDPEQVPGSQDGILLRRGGFQQGHGAIPSRSDDVGEHQERHRAEAGEEGDLVQIRGSGSDAWRARNLTRDLKRRWGRLGYAIAAFRVLAGMRPFRADVYSGWYGHAEFSHGPINGLGAHFIDMVHFIISRLRRPQ